MEGVIENLGAEIIELYQGFISFLSPTMGEFFNLLVLVLLIVLYSIFIWKFYRFVSTKNFLGLNLNKYNTSQSPFFTKLLKGAFYFSEYIIILPFLIFFWFSIFTIFLILLSTTPEISQILIISAAVIASIRAVAYYKEDLSREIAKLFPFTLLAIIVLNPNTFSEVQYVEKIATHLNQIPNFFSQIGYYLLFIIILEIILRFFDFIFSLFGLEEVEVKGNEKDTEKENEEEN